MCAERAGSFARISHQTCVRRLAGVVLLSVVTSLTAAPADLPLPPRGLGGSLVICGGGPLPEPIVEEFLKLAGGQSARLVVIPTAAASVEEGDAAEALKTWTARGVTSVRLLHTRSREMADSPDFVAPLGEATAVWIGGGDQKRLADAYRRHEGRAGAPSALGSRRRDRGHVRWSRDHDPGDDRRREPTGPGRPGPGPAARRRRRSTLSQTESSESSRRSPREPPRPIRPRRGRVFLIAV